MNSINPINFLDDFVTFNVAVYCYILHADFGLIISQEKYKI